LHKDELIKKTTKMFEDEKEEEEMLNQAIKYTQNVAKTISEKNHSFEKLVNLFPDINRRLENVPDCIKLLFNILASHRNSFLQGQEVKLEKINFSTLDIRRDCIGFLTRYIKKDDNDYDDDGNKKLPLLLDLIDSLINHNQDDLNSNIIYELCKNLSAHDIATIIIHWINNFNKRPRKFKKLKKSISLLLLHIDPNEDYDYSSRALIHRIYSRDPLFAKELEYQFESIENK
jgi:hypothetical protein